MIFQFKLAKPWAYGPSLPCADWWACGDAVGKSTGIGITGGPLLVVIETGAQGAG
jgi:hypothetical protein